MSPDDLLHLSGQQLSEYLWSRLRLEGIMDPPLSRRFRLEPPEDFMIRSCLERADPAFKNRLVEAASANVRRLMLLLAAREISDTDANQIASLAFLASALEEPRLAKSFYNLALAMAADGPHLKEQGALAVFHVLRTIAELQNDSALVPFWLGFIRTSRYPNIRSIAYYGLVRADATRLRSELPHILSDVEIDLPTLIWSFASNQIGVIGLARAARALPLESRARIAEILESNGVSDHMLLDYDLNSTNQNLQGFRFDVPEPRDLELAQEMPRLAA